MILSKLHLQRPYFQIRVPHSTIRLSARATAGLKAQGREGGAWAPSQRAIYSGLTRPPCPWSQPQGGRVPQTRPCWQESERRRAVRAAPAPSPHADHFRVSRAASLQPPDLSVDCGLFHMPSSNLHFTAERTEPQTCQATCSGSPVPNHTLSQLEMERWPSKPPSLGAEPDSGCWRGGWGLTLQ